MRFLSLTLVACLSVACSSVPYGHNASAAEHPEAKPYDETRDAKLDVETTLAKSQAESKTALIVMGANWCHDSRALAGWFATPRFESFLNQNFVVTYVDVGQKDRNIDIAQKFGIEKIVGTPTMVMVAPDGTVLNRETAVTWRNSASRTEDEIFDELKTIASQ